MDTLYLSGNKPNYEQKLIVGSCYRFNVSLAGTINLP